VVLDRASSRPLAVQLADALRTAAAGGTLRPGDRLPSTRELAAALRVSRTVTAAAYDQLLAEGWAAGRRGAGTFVVGRAPAGPVAGPPRATEPARAAAAVDLRAGSPCLEVLDAAAWRRAWRAAGDRPPDHRPEPAADPAFQAAVTGHLLRHRGLPVEPGAVLATAGTSAAVTEFARLLPAGARVGVEDPGYRRAVGALQAAGVEVVPCPVDDDGLVVDAVPGGLAAVYCTPAHQWPLGRRLSASRRAALVTRARAEGWWVLEDDYDGELRYDVAPLPLLAALAPDVVVHLGTSSKIFSPTLGTGWLVAPPVLRDELVAARTATGTRPPRAGQRVLAALAPDVVVHLGTSSKILSPTLGTGWLVAPPVLRDELVAARTATGTRPPRAGQRVLAALAASGDLARHLRRLRRELAARRGTVVDALARSGVTVAGDAAGAHVFVPLPDRATETAVVSGAAARGLAVDGLDRHLAGPGPHAPAAGLVLGFAAPARAELERALPVLGAILSRT
jgi:GntR family transcriptional regulator/MocR family aminotransferase